MKKRGYVYIMSNKWRTTIYIGVTSDLVTRIYNHRRGTGSKFTSKYYLDRLLYVGEWDSIVDAIAREKQLKRWHREWKWNLIKQQNPDLKDLYYELF